MVDIQLVEVLNCGAEVDEEIDGVEFVALSGALNQAATAIADTRTITWSGFFKADDLTVGPFVFWVSQPGSLDAFSITVGGTGDGYGVSVRCVEGPGVVSEFYFDSVDELSPDQWYHIFISADTNAAAGLKTSNLYINGANVTRGLHVDADAAFDISISGNNIGFGAASQNRHYCNVMMWTDQCIDPTPTNLAKFRNVDGSAVDPDEAIAEFGAPAILFTGGADDFIVNAGSGGSFTAAGTINDSAGPP